MVDGSGASTSTSSDVIDDVGDYEIDSHGTAGVSGSEQHVAAAVNGEVGVQSPGVAPSNTASGTRVEGRTPSTAAVRRKRRFDTLPARDMQTRAAKMKRYRFEKRTHQKVLHVSPSPYRHDDLAAAESQCDVSPCQVCRTFFDFCLIYLLYCIWFDAV